MKTTGNTWVIVLAAGDGGPSLVQEALARARAVARPEQICVVVAAQHERYWRHGLGGVPPANVIVQPQNRGTAIGILLPLLQVLRRDPAARVLLLPADLQVTDEALLAVALRRAMQVVNLQPHKIILLGVAPDTADPELGYIVPGAVDGPGTHAVVRFVEKPVAALAAALIAAGGLWNAYIVAADAATLATLFRTHLPAAYDRLQDAVAGNSPLPDAYAGLPTVDFSHGILQGSESVLRVLATEALQRTEPRMPVKVQAGVQRASGTARTSPGPDLHGP